jgi:Tol biopolymer transport system component
MSNDERIDDQLQRFLVWQAGRLDGTPDAHGMALRIGRRSATRSADRPRLVWAIVAVALVAALAAAAALVGGRLIEGPPTAGLLAYSLNDDIYLADQDGAHPRKVADGVPWIDAGGGPSYLFGDGGPAWAPDGRHFLYFDMQGAPAQLTGHIADASGHVVASIPNIWVDATWSPDSTRIEAWTGGSAWIGTTQISIYGLDGALQESLPLPAGYVRFREHPGSWAPDGRSVYVRPNISEIWQLPVEGSAPRRLAQDDLIARSHGDVRFSPDGSRMVGNVAGTLFVANADGTDPRAVVPAGASSPIWSPTGTQLAYVWSFDGGTYDIRVVDIASGTDRTVVTGLQVNGLGLLGWSPAGDRLLFAGLDQKGSSLWSINADGTDRKLLVPGATGGAWQPVQTRTINPLPPSSSPPAEPSPTSAAVSPTVPTLPPFTRTDQGFLLDEQTGGAATGHLGPGTYTFTNVDAQGFNVRFTVPAGWTWYGSYLGKGGIRLPSGAAIFFFGGPVQVYADPCHWAGAQANPPTGPSVDDLMTSLATQPLRSATTPIDRPAAELSLGVRPGSTNPPADLSASGPQPWAGRSVELTVPNDINFATCDAGQFRSWGPDSVARTHQGPGQRDLVWAIDLTRNGVVSGHGYVIIDAASFPGTPTDVSSEIDAILGSIVAGHWG